VPFRLEEPCSEDVVAADPEALPGLLCAGAFRFLAVVVLGCVCGPGVVAFAVVAGLL
jgi:hypothetical protein